jgi:CheY-like chemotaxis protein
VDNDAQVLAILTEMLREESHEVVPVVSGPAAMDAFRPGAFDVILTDLGMVGMTGWEVAQRIRALDRKVPVIFITGWGLQEEDRERCRHLGIHHVLFKPVGPGELHRTIQSTLAEHPARS